jgi:hypothetical protein
MLDFLEDQAIMSTRRGDGQEIFEEGDGAAEQLMKTLSIDEGPQAAVEVGSAKY